MPAESCRICGGGDLAHYRVREMMFGIREQFRYFQCGACGCLQLADPPDDLARFYPDDYYAHGVAAVGGSGPAAALRAARNRYAITGRGALGRLLHAVLPYYYPDARRWLGRDGLTTGSRILDVGCGTGQLLVDLAAQGYTRLEGVDPFIPGDVRYGDRVRIRRGTIHEIEGPFDLVMLHHSLEHIPDQVETLREAARLLAPSGECLVRVPVVGYAWEHYREHWVQIDAPRHYFLHSVESLRMTGERAGLRLVEVEHDSTELQFAGSELYRRDVPLREGDGAYSKRALREMRRRARELNRQGRGDSAAFYFRRAG